MREIYEFRVYQEYFDQFFHPEEGKSLGTDSVRLVHIDSHDSRFSEIIEKGKMFREQKGHSFFSSWNIRREYTPEELASADLFNFEPASFFEPFGEECGTVYDELVACPECGTGAVQRGPLLLRASRIPKKKDISQTMANEIVVSRRVKELFDAHGFTGVELKPVRVSRGKQISDSWYQLRVPVAEADIAAPTLVGGSPTDADPTGEYRCARGDLAGLNLLSEVSIRKETRGEDDFIATRQYVGCRRGLLRPRQLILISPRVRQVLTSEKIKAFRADIAHMA